jgi:hypothetical protein
VLVDEIDEYDHTNGNPDFAAEIVVPILSSINLLEKGSLGFKFFLSAPVYKRLDSTSKKMQKEIRYDRTLQPEPYVLNWNDKSIAGMLKKRLMSYGFDKINSLQGFCADDINDIDGQIVKYAFNNPRHMIQLGNRIIRYAARSAMRNDYLITKSILDSALTDFCKEICKRLYNNDYVNAIVEFNRLTILDSEFATSNKIDTAKAREILDELTNLGALKCKTNLNGDKSYSVSDPRICYMIEHGIS